jgi:modification methylase
MAEPSRPDHSRGRDSEAHQPLPLSVWPTAQQPAAAQRAGRYLPASTAHPAKMLPAIARHAIQHYSHPGDLVLDPMCGIGTTLVEAVHLGRHTIGVELEARWAELARANTVHARTHGAAGTATVVTGDARQLPSLLDPRLVGRVALVLTSPPYGSSIHGQVTARSGRGVAKYDNTYSPDPANLGRVPQATLLAALGEILAGCQALLRPNGLVVLTARPYRHRERLVDLSGQLTRVAEAARLVLYERNAALLVGLRGERLVPRPSFFQLDRVRKARARGLPLRIIAHEDVLVFRRLLTPTSSDELK